jgi:hypothetical protein
MGAGSCQCHLLSEGNWLRPSGGVSALRSETLFRGMGFAVVLSRRLEMARCD